MSYRKKSHFSGAQIRASNLESFLDNHLVQTNSASIINGKTIKTEDLDIDVLYDTLMESIKWASDKKKNIHFLQVKYQK